MNSVSIRCTLSKLNTSVASVTICALKWTASLSGGRV